MTLSQETPAPAIVAPQMLLSNHLKALKLPTFAREYETVAMESAQDRADYPRYLLRLCELERIDRCLLYTSPSPRDYAASRMPSSA